MTDRPAIVPTEFGPVGAIVSEPDGPARAGLVLMQGGGAPCRYGVNRCWTRLARDLAERGIAVLRFDAASEGDSTVVGEHVPREVGWRRNTDLAVMRELVPWFRERVAFEDLFVSGSCHGGRVAMDYAAESREVRGTFLVVPYLWNVPPGHRPDKQVSQKRNLPRAGELFDHGSSDVGAHRQAVGEVEAVTDESRLEDSFLDAARRAMRGGPLWILIGEGDSHKAVELKERLGPEGEALEVEVVPGMIVHPVTHPEVQELVMRRLTEQLLGALSGRSSAPAAS